MKPRILIPIVNSLPGIYGSTQKSCKKVSSENDNIERKLIMLVLQLSVSNKLCLLGRLTFQPNLTLNNSAK